MHFVMYMFGSLCSSGHPSTSRWPSAVNSALEILLEIPISTSWILQRPSKANQRHQPPRRSSQHSVAQGVLPRAKATQEDTAEQSGEKVHMQERLFSQPRCYLYDQHGFKEQPTILSLTGLGVLEALCNVRACCPKTKLHV